MQMNTRIPDGIKRSDNGGIDYNHYLEIGNRARFLEIKLASGAVRGIAAKLTRVLPIVTILIALNVVF